MNPQRFDTKKPRYSWRYLIAYGAYCSTVAIVVFEFLR